MTNIIDELNAEQLKTNTTAHWREALDRADVPNGKVRMLADLPTDPYLQASGFFHHYSHPMAGDMVTPSIPVSFSATPGEIRTPPPTLGEHTREVLQEFGVDEQDIQALAMRS